MTIDEICFSGGIAVLGNRSDVLSEYKDEINAGTFEVILRRVPIKEE